MADAKLKWKGGVAKDPKTGSWVVSYRQHGRRRMARRHPVSREPFRTKREAQQFKLDIERPPSERGHVQETVEQFVARYMRDHRRSVAETTRMWYRERLAKFATDFKGRRLSSITRQEAVKWAGENEDRVKAVRSMFATAVDLEADGIDSNPFRRLGKAQGKGRRGIRMLTEDELGALVKVAREHHGPAYGNHFAAVIEALAGTGMRPGELFGLEWQDVDWQKGEIHIRRQYVSKTDSLEEYTKTNAGRRVPLLPSVAEALRGIERIEGAPYVFHTVTGKRFAAWNFRHVWTPVRDAFAAKLPSDHWLRRRIRSEGTARGSLDAYELRHLYGTMLARRGATPYVIASLMGHKDGGRLAMKLYIHTENDEAIAEARRLFAAELPPSQVSTG